jgi:pimeloyl-ACP methyl ester carboxylesterase
MKNILPFNHAPREGSELEPATHVSSDLSPLVVIGGLMTVKRLAKYYRPTLDIDTTSDIEPEERFIAPPKKGIASPEVIRAELTDQLEELYEKLGKRKMFLVGHSLGGLLATAAAVERPDRVSGVVSLGGVHDGIRENVGTNILRRVLGNPEEAKYILHDSPDIQEHREKMAGEWPKDTPLHVVSTPLDLLLVPPQGYGVELANGQPKEKLLLPPPFLVPGTESRLRRHMRIEAGVQTLRTMLFTGHLWLPRDPTVINYIESSRRAVASATNHDLVPAEYPMPAMAAAV